MTCISCRDFTEHSSVVAISSFSSKGRPCSFRIEATDLKVSASKAIVRQMNVFTPSDFCSLAVRSHAGLDDSTSKVTALTASSCAPVFSWILVVACLLSLGQRHEELTPPNTTGHVHGSRPLQRGCDCKAPTLLCKDRAVEPTCLRRAL